MIKLGPKNIAEILDESFRICRQNWIKFSLITVIPDLIALLPTALVGYGIIKLDTGPILIRIHIFDFVIFSARVGQVPFLIWGMLLSLPPLGALMWAISESYLGRKVSVKESYRFLAKNFWSFVGSLFLMAIIIGSGFLLIIVPGFIFLVWFIFTPWVVSLEGLAPISALRRAKKLTEGSFWRMIFLGAIFFLAFIAMTSFAESLYFGGAEMFLKTVKGVVPYQWPNWILIIAASLYIAIGIFLFWLAIAVGTIFYYDLRIRKEGFDLEMKAKELFQKQG